MLSSRLLQSKGLVLELLLLCALALEQSDSLIITSVIAGNKKFKTVSFDSKFLKPLTFEKDLPSTEFRRHRTMRPPKFDIDVNIPIKLPLEEEYPHDEYKKPVVNDFFFQSGEIQDDKKYPSAPQKRPPIQYTDEQYAASSNQEVSVANVANTLMRDGFKGILPALAKSIKIHPQIEFAGQSAQSSNARADIKQPMAPFHSQQQQSFQIQPQQIDSRNQQENLTPSASYPNPSYLQHGKGQEPEFVPGGFINLQLSGPTGGPKMTYEDYDKERWAQQLSQTDGAMPYPILNYHQLQNFYGGLGTFTNGLAEHRYVENGLWDKLKSSLNHLTSKLHIG